MGEAHCAERNRVILAWGNHGTWRKQDLYILQLLKNHTHLYSLGITKQGCPRHPLYLRSNTQPQTYDNTAFCQNLTATNNAIGSNLVDQLIS